MSVKVNMPDEITSSKVPFAAVPDLIDVRQPDDGGAINLHGVKYQFHFAAWKCLEMLTCPDKIEYVACELHDDVVAKLCAGTYEFYQVKERTGELWSIASLHSEGVWRRFLEHRENFGDGHAFAFVSDQDALTMSGNKSDLGRMMNITDRGKSCCTPTEMQHADELVDRLAQILGLSQANAETLFWNTKILARFERPSGLVQTNLGHLEQILADRGMDSSLGNRVRVYRDIVSKLEDPIAEPPIGATFRQRLELRKVRSEDIEVCLTVAKQGPQPGCFDLVADPEYRDLHQKLEEAKFPSDCIRFMKDSRNRFCFRYRQDLVHAADYLDKLRWKVWDICIAGKVSTTGNTPSRPVRLYSAIRTDLQRLADQEASQSPPVVVDFEYLHGMLCQLTAECNYEWRQPE